MYERSYDHEHGGGLHDLLVEQVSKSTSGFEIRLDRGPPGPDGSLGRRAAPRDPEADEVIICGEH